MEVTEPPAPASLPVPRPRRSNCLSALVIVLSFRLGLIAFAYLSRALVDMPHPHADNAFPGNLFLDGWVQWDSGWYARIAQHGYTNQIIGDGERDTAFFPLLPLLARAVALLVGDVNLAGFLVCNTALVGAGMLFYKLGCEWLDAESAERGLILLCAWPYAYALGAMYAESLFLLAAVGMFTAAHRQRWLIAGLCAAAASAARPPGILLTPILVFAYLHHAQWNPRSLRANCLYTLLGLCGLGGYAVYLWMKFGDPLAMIRAQSAPMWGGRSSWVNLVDLLRDTSHSSFGTIASGNVPLVDLLQLVLLLCAVLALTWVWRKLPGTCALWATAALFLAGTRWISGGRQVAVIFPLFLAAGSVLRGRAFAAVLYGSTLLLALATFLFCQSMWIG